MSRTSQIAKSINYLKDQMASRSIWTSSIITPDDPNIGLNSPGPWTGSFTDPTNPFPLVPYSAVRVLGPLFFPINPGVITDFTGTVDCPFFSMDGYAGKRQTPDPSHVGAPVYIDDPTTEFANDGTGNQWGSFFVLGTCHGVTQFRARVASNATWTARVDNPPFGDGWVFQLVTYPTRADYDADTNRVLIEPAWLQSERPGDVRRYYSRDYTPFAGPQFSDVVLTPTDGGVRIQGTLESWTPEDGKTYKVLVTTETDVEYAFYLFAAVEGPFDVIPETTITYDAGPPENEVEETFNNFLGAGKIKLRLIEMEDGCAQKTVGQVWSQENAAAGASYYPDLRIEYRSITTTLPFFPSEIVAAKLDNTWDVTHIDDSLGWVRLVHCGTKQILSEYKMPSGFMRSFLVLAEEAGQNTTSVYYDGFSDTCFLYDQAVALIAFLQTEEQEAASKLVTMLLRVQNEDGSFPFANNQHSLDHNSDFIRIGAVAWVSYALLLAGQERYENWFDISPKQAGRDALDYCMTYINSAKLIKGGKGQYVDNVLDPDYVVPWWSTEHNIDLWWCLDLADQFWPSEGYRTNADDIKSALLGIGWDATNDVFWQGGGHDGDPSHTDGSHALDTHTWGASLLAKWGETDKVTSSLLRAYELYYTYDVEADLYGYTTFVPEDGYPEDTVKSIWYEGSFGAVVAFRSHDPDQANTLMDQLLEGQRSDGSWLYALKTDAVNDIHPWPCIIAPAWSVLALSGPGSEFPDRVVWPSPSTNSFFPGGIFGLQVYGVDGSSYAPLAQFPERPVAEKVLFLSTRTGDLSTLTASSQVDSLPVQNVQNQEPSKVWRTTSNTSQYVDFTMKSVTAVNAAAITWPYGALSSSALGRLELYASLADRTDGIKAADSGWTSVWPNGYKHSDPDWGPEVGLIRLSNDEAYRYGRIRLTDPGCPNPYLDIGRLTLGRVTQFRVNPGYDGGIGFVPIDVQEPNGYGQIFTDPRPYQQRQFELVWATLAELEATEDAMELSRLRGQAGDLFVFLNPSDMLGYHRKSMQALFEGGHKYTPVPTYMVDKDGNTRLGWGFTLTLTQKL